MSRKSYCKNIRCKHNASDNKCNVTINIGDDGKCESFEKGFIYYIHLIWDELAHSNYIDFIRINANSDIRIGLYYVMKLYHVVFSEMEFGTCRLLMLHKEEDSNGLKYDDFKNMEMDTEEFCKLFYEFDSGILPTLKAEKPKKNSQPFGWLAPSGKFLEADFSKHEEAAENIIGNECFIDEYNEWIIGDKGLTHRDFLNKVKGYCLIHNPSGIGGYIVSNLKPLTKKQREFLYEYFNEIGDRFKAEQYLL